MYDPRYDPRYVYFVDGPVPGAVRKALDDRYGESGWYSPWEERTKIAQVRQIGKSNLVEYWLRPSYVFRPADPTGYLLRKDKGFTA